MYDAYTPAYIQPCVNAERTNERASVASFVPENGKLDPVAANGGREWTILKITHAPDRQYTPDEGRFHYSRIVFCHCRRPARSQQRKARGGLRITLARPIEVCGPVGNLISIFGRTAGGQCDHLVEIPPGPLANLGRYYTKFAKRPLNSTSIKTDLVKELAETSVLMDKR